MHWLILFPYYFFTALCLFLLSSLICRAVRAKVSANPLAMTAVVAAIALTALPLITGATQIDDYSWPGLLGLLLASLVLALLDTVLKPSLSLPLDEELEEV